MKVKICGITNLDDALLAETLGASAVGFIFHKKSKRYISPENASEIINKLSPFTLKVGVFVNEEPEAINKISTRIKLNVVQLHGDETYNIIEKIDLPVIKSFRINGVFDFTVLNNYKNVSFLFDSYSKEEYGGTGKNFNWDLIPTELKGNFILAGGISIDNIKEVFSKVKPKAIDVSSSLEKSPGIKDHLKVKEFFKRFNSIRSL
ncbi:MAG TPA: phosphoribosylanthranilate isomerase [Ignavibacteriaceae bacterium]|nr:phosphoribosylanthranilate isomerase [Ignavibacteriaceae bacterium]